MEKLNISVLASLLIHHNFGTFAAKAVISLDYLETDSTYWYRSLDAGNNSAESLQLHYHFITNNLFEKLHPGFQPARSTKTALIKVTNDLMAADADPPSHPVLHSI